MASDLGVIETGLSQRGMRVVTWIGQCHRDGKVMGRSLRQGGEGHRW